ncbi:protein of unknown function [Alteromonadaceae bacterium Bs31]|nr:protein of unknown function [Alteromonadaceae bacterium Bs31]
MDCQLQPQLKNASEIRDVLKEVDVSFTLADGREIQTLLVYLPIDGGVSCYSDFFDKIKDGILYNFVFSCSEIEKKLGIKNSSSAEELFDKAIRKLSKHTAKGELGELILFTLLDVYIRAPKILSKVSLKTNRKMPVFGADAVHCQFHDGKIRLYLGESKLYKKFKSAATDAADSIKKAKGKYEEEFDLLDSYMDFPNINEVLEEELLNTLNPFDGDDISDVIHSPCFIGFSEPEIISSASSEDEFIEKYKKVSGEYISDFFSKVELHGMTVDETALLMLPFSCVDELVAGFIEHMGIKE